jgi:hypothetical protein
MRVSVVSVNLFILSLLGFFLSCLTVDPPRPDLLSAPHFTGYQIIAVPDYANEYQETIRLHWIPDSTDPISPISYEIIRQADTDSFPSYIRNIPDTIHTINEPTHKFDELDRTEEHLIFYRIFAYDSLGRTSDTSAVCTVALARNLILMHPENIMSDPAGEEYFKWEISEGINNYIIYHVCLWKDDSLIWESDPKGENVGNMAVYREEKLPSIYSPLTKNKYYYWGVALSIIDIYDPASITIRNFYVE